MMVILDANKLQQDQDVLVENGMPTPLRTAGKHQLWIFLGVRAKKYSKSQSCFGMTFRPKLLFMSRVEF